MIDYQPQGERTIDAGKRCAITASEWLPGWWVSYSPRNGNNNAEGPWCHWVHLARQILADDLTVRHMPEHYQPYPDPPDVYDGHHPDCRDCADDPTEDPTPMTTRHESEIDRLRQWKSSAIELLNEWDKVWDAAGRPGPLGGSKAANVLRVLADRKQGPDTMTHTSVDICAWCTDCECDGIGCIASLDPNDSDDYGAIDHLHAVIRAGKVQLQANAVLAKAEGRWAPATSRTATDSTEDPTP